MNIKKQKLLYSGKAKSLYHTDHPDLLIAEFRDDTTAFDGEKHEKLADKGMVNNLISAFLMERLKEAGIPTHFESLLSDNETVVKRLTMIPLENVIRNIAAGSLCRRLGVKPGLPLNPALYELFLKNDELHDPLVTEQHALVFGWATSSQLEKMKQLTHQINEVLTKIFKEADLLLVDAKYEFGMDKDGIICVGDEISPDSCRVWDAQTGESLDKDRFRKDLGDVIPSYQKIAHRLGIQLSV